MNIFSFGEPEFDYRKQDQGSTEKHFNIIVVSFEIFASLQGNTINQKNAYFIQNVTNVKI